MTATRDLLIASVQEEGETKKWEARKWPTTKAGNERDEALGRCHRLFSINDRRKINIDTSFDDNFTGVTNLEPCLHDKRGRINTPEEYDSCAAKRVKEYNECKTQALQAYATALRDITKRVAEIDSDTSAEIERLGGRRAR